MSRGDAVFTVAITCIEAAQQQYLMLAEEHDDRSNGEQDSYYWKYFYQSLFFLSTGMKEDSKAYRLQMMISSMLMPSTSWAMRYSLFRFVSSTSGSSELIVKRMLR